MNNGQRTTHNIRYPLTKKHNNKKAQPELPVGLFHIYARKQLLYNYFFGLGVLEIGNSEYIHSRHYSLCDYFCVSF